MAFVSNDAMEFLWQQEMQYLADYRKLYERRRDLRRQWSTLWFEYVNLMKASGLRVGTDPLHMAPPAAQKAWKTMKTNKAQQRLIAQKFHALKETHSDGF